MAEYQQQPLIPGFPEDVARQCLLRIAYTDFCTVKSVCKQWNDEVYSAPFHRLRKSSGVTSTVVAMVQADPASVTARSALSQNKQSSSTSASPAYRLVLFEPATGAWSALPAAPCLPNGLPLFCQVAAAGRSLVVVGGWNPATWVASDEVLVYDFLSASWRRGARMPGPRRSFFASASDGDRWVFIAGGHDEEKNALRSALAYDAAGDRWVTLPDMAAERDECKGIFRRGRFTVLGGYSTDFQGQFGKSSESFDVATFAWGPVEEDTLDVGVCPRTCTASDGGTTGERMYRCRGGKVEMKEEGGSWGAVAELPEEVKVAPWVAVVEEGKVVVVVGAKCHGGEHEVHVLEVDEGRWRRVAASAEFSGHVQAGCCIQI